MAEFYKRGTYNLKGGLLIDATITEFTACSDLVAGEGQLCVDCDLL
jgi:hypothetical protein